MCIRDRFLVKDYKIRFAQHNALPDYVTRYDQDRILSVSATEIILWNLQDGSIIQTHDLQTQNGSWDREKCRLFNRSRRLLFMATASWLVEILVFDVESWTFSKPLATAHNFNLPFFLAGKNDLLVTYEKGGMAMINLDNGKATDWPREDLFSYWASENSDWVFGYPDPYNPDFQDEDIPLMARRVQDRKVVRKKKLTHEGRVKYFTYFHTQGYVVVACDDGSVYLLKFDDEKGFEQASECTPRIKVPLSYEFIANALITPKMGIHFATRGEVLFTILDVVNDEYAQSFRLHERYILSAVKVDKDRILFLDNGLRVLEFERSSESHKECCSLHHLYNNPKNMEEHLTKEPNALVSAEFFRTDEGGYHLMTALRMIEADRIHVFVSNMEDNKARKLCEFEVDPLFFVCPIKDVVLGLLHCDALKIFDSRIQKTLRTSYMRYGHGSRVIPMRDEGMSRVVLFNKWRTTKLVNHVSMKVIKVFYEMSYPVVPRAFNLITKEERELQDTIVAVNILSCQRVDLVSGDLDENTIREFSENQRELVYRVDRERSALLDISRRQKIEEFDLDEEAIILLVLHDEVIYVRNSRVYGLRFASRSR
eukprot:TRINITY_DN425_c0_g1_i1.p1 TRINITY_DN425_c0_g1~~TRINITY_DN425_c0_g1_i1.p1  ORF type:complete len:612 (-),score=44.54 TRINITY_DN425_c0_g1_i1:65-1852(-)